MDDTKQLTAVPDDATEITLGLLNAVAESSTVTQRSMAGELGIALGLANAYLKSCIKKGLIKVSQAPANRYSYYLTPHGFAEKSRLTAEYLSISFNFFRAARRQCSEVFDSCALNSWRRIVLAGTGDLTEIAILCVADHAIEIVAIIDPGMAGETYVGIPVISKIEDATGLDAVVVTDFESPQRVFDHLSECMPTERVLAPRLLNVSRVRPNLVD